LSQCLRRYAHTCPDGDHDGRITRRYLFICLQPVKSILGTRGSSGATLSQKVSAEAHVTCGGPELPPSREAGAGAAGARSGPGVAPSREVRVRATGEHGSPGAAPQPGGESCCLDLMFVCEGTRSSWYRQIVRKRFKI
jgi:hypothetical protein